VTDRADLLTTKQMASFAARGFIRLDAVVPDGLNREFLEGAEKNEIPAVPPGVPLAEAYEDGSPLWQLVNTPRVRGAIESLVGPGSTFDHHFLHIAFPPEFFSKRGWAQRSQATHQDSTIDPRPCFDAQLFYFPHDVTRDMGGTRFVPGSHLRIVSEAATARYQNVRGQAGTVIFFHHGLWHGGGINHSERTRYMFKVRLQPTVRQTRLWNTDDLRPEDFEPRPIFWVRDAPDPDSLHSILTRLEPWYEADTGRLEILNRIRFWRFLLGDEKFDVDYWLTRVENVPAG